MAGKKFEEWLEKNSFTIGWSQGKRAVIGQNGEEVMSSNHLTLEDAVDSFQRRMDFFDNMKTRKKAEDIAMKSIAKETLRQPTTAVAAINK